MAELNSSKILLYLSQCNIRNYASTEVLDPYSVADIKKKLYILKTMEESVELRSEVKK
jgi:hypothetical protein